RKRPLSGEIGVVHRAEITVEVSGGIKGLAQRVAAEQRQVIAEPFFHFKNSAFVQSRAQRRVLVALQKQRIRKAVHNTGTLTRQGVPVPEGSAATVGERYGG